jgi:hypothetical protein
VSSSSTQVSYAVAIDLERGGAQASANFNIPQELDLTDSDVLAWIEYLRAYTWPTGLYSAFTVTKSAQTTVAYTTDLASIPPAFN